MSLTVDIRKTLGRFTLQVQLEAGDEAVALLGGSGSGKSMTLRCIAGIERPDEGKIILNGETLFDSAGGINLPPQKRRVGLLFQNYALFPNMTVEQNVQAGLDKGLRGEARRAKIGEMLEALYLTGLEKRLPAQLSGGQQQRVALARILLSSPRILMLDEPFSALDSFLRWELEQTVGDVVSAFGGTTLVVSHNRDEAYRLCSKIAVVHNGRIEALGNRDELFRHPRTAQAALLTGCKNIAPAAPAEGSRVFVPDWNLTLLTSEAQPHGLKSVGIRAHMFSPGVADANRFSARVEKRIQSPFSLIFLLRPEGALRPLRWESEDLTLPFQTGDRVELSVSPQHVLCLR